MTRPAVCGMAPLTGGNGADAMTGRACLTALLFATACATSTLSAKPLTIGTEWTTLTPGQPIRGGRERFVLVTSPEDGPVECDAGKGIVWRYRRAVTIE